MCIRPASVFLVSDCFKNEETRILNHFKNQVMCDNSVCGDSHSLKYIPDWSVKEKLVKYNIMMLITMILILLSGLQTTKRPEDTKKEEQMPISYKDFQKQRKVTTILTNDVSIVLLSDSTLCNKGKDW